MATTRGKGILRKFFILICSVIIASGCAEVQTTFNRVLSNLRAQMDGSETGTRDEAIRRYNYRGLQDQMFAEQPKVFPSAASPEDEITQELTFALLAPRPEKTFKVLEVVSLSGSNILIELSRKDTSKMQGIHVSTVKFMVPRDLPRGNYRIVTSVSANGLEMKRNGGFTVR
ncbi:hypothetical protein [Syntrophorhabdus aromaticivorans]|uniref:hypothetical protein n=1 Tax=Syntrophorhabdus aromaticivorans TaxID=328301 RepID=UPI00048F33D2|nr:hypothetical protein [Syntrophorhabdus aromaticivorans]